jgi:CheY-like chemotaxis protein
MHILFLTDCHRECPEIIREAFDDCDAKVITTISVPEAIDLVSEQPIDLVFLDCDLVPPGQATTLLLADVPVMICCSADRREGIVRLFRDIADGVIVKDTADTYPAFAAAIRHHYYQSPRLAKSRLNGVKH